MVQDLYAKYPDVDALAEATPEEIEAIVRPCGLGKSKARDISACMKMLRDEYDGKVPCDFDAILKLPGVGRKSANLIMGDVFKKPAIVTDTHCIRLTNRIGLVDGIKDPKKVRNGTPGRSFHRKKVVISATDSFIMAERSVQREQSLTVTDAAWRISVQKMEFKIWR